MFIGAPSWSLWDGFHLVLFGCNGPSVSAQSTEAVYPAAGAPVDGNIWARVGEKGYGPFYELR